MGMIQKTRRGKTIIAFCLLLACLCTMVFSQSAYAAPAANPVTLEVDQVFTQPASSSAADTFTYKLAANVAGNPMPSGSVGGEYSFTISGTDSANIGPITFAQTGIYNYEIEQYVASSVAGYTYDAQVYTVTVYINAGLQADIIVKKADGAKTDSIAFKNTYAPLAIDKFVAAEGTTDYYEVTKNLPVEKGERFNWYIRTQLPSDINPARIDYYTVSDTLGSYFEYQPGSVTVYVMPASDSDLANCTILSSGDYTVSFDPATNTLTAGLSSAGITKVKNLVDAGNSYAVLAYSCIVNDTAPQGVALYSGATLEYTRGTAGGVSSRGSAQTGAVTLLSAGSNTGIAMLANTGNTMTVEVADQPEVHTGKIGITKLADKTNKLLPGAEFGIAKTKTDALAGNYIATGTTDGNGELVFNGLKYGQPGDDPTQNSNNTTFWLVETKAPDGYKLMKEPAEITSDYSQDEEGKYYFARVNVYNVLSSASGETSPKTGDTSNLLLWLGIMALALVGIVTAVILLKKRTADGAEQS